MFFGEQLRLLRLVANRRNILVLVENIANEKLNQSYMAGWFHGFQLSNVSVTFVPLLCFYISLIHSFYYFILFIILLLLFFISFFIFPNSFIHSGEPQGKKGCY